MLTLLPAVIEEVFRENVVSDEQLEGSCNNDLTIDLIAEQRADYVLLLQESGSSDMLRYVEDGQRMAVIFQSYYALCRERSEVIGV
jgi:hypothetical protein